MNLSAAATSYVFAATAARQSSRTIEWKEQKLAHFTSWCESQGVQDTSELAGPHLHAYVATLPDDWSSYTRHGYAQVLKSFLRWCWREDLVSEKLVRRLVMPKVDTHIIQTFTPQQMKALLAACAKDGKLAARDRALLSVLMDTGIRVGEACRLRVEDVHLTRDESYLRVFGKGRKEREVGLGQQCRTTLYSYIHRYRMASGEVETVFVADDGKPLTPGGVDQLIKRLGRLAGISGVRCSAHTFRHTYAVSYLAAGGDVYKLARLLGHNSVTTTEVYLRAFQARMARRGGHSLLDNL